MTIQQYLPEEEELLRSPLTAESIEANFQQQLQALEEEFSEKTKQLEQEEVRLTCDSCFCCDMIWNMCVFCGFSLN